ncbi:MAG: hypothetical protein HKL80_01050, partial [Acidimicrobiales bacterium]|nr:hypothetical protein [Acidimicrobiales bacterium]
GAQSNGNRCTSNSNPNYGLPTGSTTFSQAWVNATSSSSDNFVAPCEKANGTWYVYLQNTSANSGNSGNIGSPTGSRQAESNLGNAIIELNAVYLENLRTFYLAGTNIVTQLQQGDPTIFYVATRPSGPNEVQVGTGGTSGNLSQIAEAVAYSSETSRCYAIFINKSNVSMPTTFPNSNLNPPSGTTYGASTTTVSASECTMGVESPLGIIVSGASQSISMDWQANGFPTS